jgi:hypothetical protein
MNDFDSTPLIARLKRLLDIIGEKTKEFKKELDMCIKANLLKYRE